jgi:hypothetical protein
LNDAYKRHIESRWSTDLPPIPTVPFTFVGPYPGPVGVEIDALQVFERFMNSTIVESIVLASNVDMLYPTATSIEGLARKRRKLDH